MVSVEDITKRHFPVCVAVEDDVDCDVATVSVEVGQPNRRAQLSLCEKHARELYRKLHARFGRQTK